MTVRHPGYAFDAVATLGIGAPSAEPLLPHPKPGEVVLRVPAGLTLRVLCESPAGQDLMYRQRWYDRYSWSTVAVPPGVWRLRIPVPESQGLAFVGQCRLLAPGDHVAPVVLVAAALLCVRRAGEPDPLCGHWTRCGEQVSGGHHVTLTSWGGGRLNVSDSWDDGPYDHIAVSSLRAP